MSVKILVIVELSVNLRIQARLLYPRPHVCLIGLWVSTYVNL